MTKLPTDASELRRVLANPMFTAKRTGSYRDAVTGETEAIVAGRTRVHESWLRQRPDLLPYFDTSRFADSLHALSTRRRRVPQARQTTSPQPSKTGLRGIQPLTRARPAARIPRLPGPKEAASEKRSGGAIVPAVILAPLHDARDRLASSGRPDAHEQLTRLADLLAQAEADVRSAAGKLATPKTAKGRGARRARTARGRTSIQASDRAEQVSAEKRISGDGP